ncbi:hypothetical protein [Xenorhabdus bovienii]|uniref:hypothetical protein n=1 Tax=Xenorhabdus bovienii TaxID=40576 RepID=UPI003DA692EC
MSNEKIAFIHPYSPDESENPLLVFDCEEIPAIIDFHFKVFMIDMMHEKPIYLQSQLFRMEDDKIVDVCDAKGFWIKVEDTQGKPNEIVASIKLSFKKCNFQKEGTYFVKSSFLVNGEVTDSNQAYFKVSLINE